MHNVTQLINTNNYKTIYYAGLSAIALSSFFPLFGVNLFQPTHRQRNPLNVAEKYLEALLQKSSEVCVLRHWYHTLEVRLKFQRYLSKIGCLCRR